MSSKAEIKYVVFDLFGTLVKFGGQHHPFRQLLKWARENGRQVRADDARNVMTVNGGVRAISSALGIDPPADMVQEIERLIKIELSSLTLFADVIPTLNELTALGIKIGICSNLAQPYGAVIDRLLNDFDLDRFLSYELGAIKPEPQIFESILNHYQCDASECLFIGDTLEADYVGPKSVGMNALHLVRFGQVQKHQISSLHDVLEWRKIITEAERG
jgi:HAD superfamily hydrolase (TIGR01549 family)